MQPLKRMNRGKPDTLDVDERLFSEKHRCRMAYKLQNPPCVHACAYQCLYGHTSD